MERKKIFITSKDMERLQELIRHHNSSGEHSENIKELLEELKHSEVVASQNIPHDVVTMNSKVMFRDLDTREVFVYSLVYPKFANTKEQKISVLAPIGTALLGYRVGDVIDWPVPAGRRHLKIEQVVYQPEAAGEFDC